MIPEQNNVNFKDKLYSPHLPKIIDNTLFGAILAAITYISIAIMASFLFIYMHTDNIKYLWYMWYTSVTIGCYFITYIVILLHHLFKK